MRTAASQQTLDITGALSMPRGLSTTSPMQKTCRILCALTDRKHRTLSTIATATGIDKASTLRILQVLVKEGLVLRDERTKEYRYGQEAFNLAHSLQSQQDLKTLARMSVQRLVTRTEDAVAVLARSGLESVCVDREQGAYPIHASTIEVGSRRPLGAGSGSLAILAWLEDDEIELALTQLQKRLDAFPGITIKAIRKEIAAARKRGYTVLIDVVVNRMGAIGKPIFGLDGRPVGAISISALSERVMEREKHLAQWIGDETAQIEKTLRNSS